MKELLIIAISSALVSNVVTEPVLGICSFVGVSKKLKQQLVWVVRLFVITIASIVANLIYQFGSGTAWYRLPENHRFHSRYRSTGSDR